MRPLIRVGLALALVIALLGTLSAAGCRKASPPRAVDGHTAGSSESTSTTTTPSAPALDSLALELQPLLSDLEQPLFVTGSGDGSGRLFVCEKTGRIKVASPSGTTSVFLDLSGKVSTNSERGLLGLAFSPHYAQTRRFYVDYTDAAGATVISRFTTSANDDRADPASEEVLLRIEQPYANHNGGCVQFGPDGMLWIGMGDGGSGGDPHGNGQNPDVLLGKMLRIDVGESGAPANGEPYGIPSDNPYANPVDESTAGQPEIWAIGLRNPWRFSFDSKTGDLWIGDVGQDTWEEIDLVPAGSGGVPRGGQNFGWNVFEATHPYPPDRPAPSDAARFTMPVIEYDHSAGESVTGGVVVRDPEQPLLDGVYLYGDYVSGRLWGAVRDPESTAAGDTGLATAELLKTSNQIVSFGTGDAGEVYVVDFAGTVMRVTASKR